MRATLRILASRGTAIVLLLVGAASLALALGDRYGVLMNPSFRWVTISGGALVTAMGLALLHSPRGREHPGALLIFAAFFALIALARPVRDGTSVLAPPGPPAATLARAGYETFAARSVFHGFEQEAPSLGGRRVIMGGVVKRTPALDEQGRFALLEPVMACCLADAIALGLIVDLEGRAPPRDAEWIYAYGELCAAPEPLDTPPLRTGTILFTTTSKQYLLQMHDLVTYRALLEDVVEKIPAARCARFREALEESGLARELRAEGPFTVFVPLDQSFEETVGGVRDLRTYLSDFIVRGRRSKRSLFDVEVLETLSGRSLEIEVENGRLRVEGARILFGDTLGRNGIVHLIHPAWGEAGP